MKVSDLAFSELTAALEQGNLLLEVGRFVARLQTRIPAVARDVALMYGEFQLADAQAFVDFPVHLKAAGGLRRWLKPQVYFHFDDRPPFRPLPFDQAYPMLEWGLNWCISAHSHQYLIMHAAVIEKQGRAMILPAPPGSGKSTLCAGLISRGWRLLSDELALLDIHTGLIQPLARPVNLKNQSIDVIRRFWPEAVFSTPVSDTLKGTVALLRPPAPSVQRMRECARPAWVVLPRYQKGVAASLTAHSKARTFLLLADQSFNYDIHGQRGYERVTDLIEQCDCYQFVYSDLEDADRIFSALAEAPSASSTELSTQSSTQPPA